MDSMVISGGSGGIGAPLVRHYEQVGYKVVSLNSQICDIRNPDSVRKLAKDVGAIDVLINNAGIGSMNHFLLTPPETFANILNVNVLGTFNMCQQFVRKMKRGGKIINVSSVAVPLKLEGEMAYAVSKAGVEMMTKVMATELAPFDITANAVAPAPVYETGLVSGVSESKLEEIVQKLPQKRYTTIQDIIEVIDFFITSNVTGQVVYLGGAS